MKVPFRAPISFALCLSFFAAGAAMAQTGAVSNAPIAQTLVREGDFAVKLVNALNLSKTSDEYEAETVLSSAGIAPKNGWIENYPVTPDIMGQLQASISSAADSGQLSMDRSAALMAFQGVLTAYNLPLKAGGAQETVEPSGETYPNTTEINNYYYTEGPPVVTYYAPPPDYAYLYTWVTYPFWWANLWFPGFYCLVDFDIAVFHNHHREFITNHFRNPGTGRFFRVDPATGRFFTGSGARVMGPSALRGAQSILGRSVVQPAPRSFREFRGFGDTRPSPGVRSGAFQRWGSTGFEGSASTRGFQSRSTSGQIPARSFAPGTAPRAVTPARPPSGGFGAFHGSGRFMGGGAPRGGGGFRR